MNGVATEAIPEMRTMLTVMLKNGKQTHHIDNFETINITFVEADNYWSNKIVTDH